MASAGRARAAEARKRKRDQESALEGLVACMETQESADREFVNSEMVKKPHIAKILAGMIRDGRIDQAIARQAEKATATPDKQDLGRQLGKGCKSFKKLGVAVLQALLNKVAGNDSSAKTSLAYLLKTTSEGGSTTTIDNSTVGEIFHFALAVNDNTPLPTMYKDAGYVNPLVEVLFKRYVDCGSRLEKYKTVAQITKVRFWHFDPQGEAANVVKFTLGDKDLLLTLPMTADQVKEVTDWKIDAPHTFYATLSSASKFFSLPLGERLEARYLDECKSLPMKDPAEGFEYDDGFSEVPRTPSAASAPSVISSPAAPPPVAAAALLAAMPPRAD